ncbi:MAG: hypothetical protein WCK90_00285 [archaeon]
MVVTLQQVLELERERNEQAAHNLERKIDLVLKNGGNKLECYEPAGVRNFIKKWYKAAGWKVTYGEEGIGESCLRFKPYGRQQDGR